MSRTYARKDFGFVLPENLITQKPASPREAARLLHYSRDRKTIDHRHFFDLPKLLRPGDVLVFNDSRVMKARLLGKKETGGAAEVFLLHPKNGYTKTLTGRDWTALVRGRTHIGTRIEFGSGFWAEVTQLNADGTVCVRLSHAAGVLMEKKGETPLPPYIKASAPLSRYQTVFAEKAGSVAAPTAGLHFSKQLLDDLRRAGVEFAYVTLHVGAGTFLPVKTEDLKKHKMHSEYAVLSKKTADQLNRAKKEARRVIAVGTTATRTLESASTNKKIQPFAGWTDIFITPGYKFKAIDGLITNFHLPHSTLIMLVAAFMGLPETKRAYKEAVSKRYRFYSFGDGMLIE